MGSNMASSTHSYHHGDLRRALLDAALRLITDQGLAGFTLREAARAAGVSHNAPYRHFPSRDHLLAELAIEGHGLLRDHMLAAMERSPSQPLERLLAIGAGYADFAIQNPALFRVMFASEAARDDSPLLQLERGKTFGMLELELAHCVAAGVLRCESTSDAALAGWAAMHGISFLFIDGGMSNRPLIGGRTPNDIARLVLEMLLSGLRTGTDPSSAIPAGPTLVAKEGAPKTRGRGRRVKPS
ncbi:MAG: TetR/AcrR family transcriptional regulator [Planctomyces sp.]|nr:TetR/AcrR family transcriptional regulator [Planctomyces sp.]